MSLRAFAWCTLHNPQREFQGAENDLFFQLMHRNSSRLLTENCWSPPTNKTGDLICWKECLYIKWLSPAGEILSFKVLENISTLT